MLFMRVSFRVGDKIESRAHGVWPLSAPGVGGGLGGFGGSHSPDFTRFRAGLNRACSLWSAVRPQGMRVTPGFVRGAGLFQGEVFARERGTWLGDARPLSPLRRTMTTRHSAGQRRSVPWP
jgi:hypothetical protein